MTQSLTVPLDRHFADGRRAEVVVVAGGAFVRVYAPSGRLYIEKPFDSIAEATVALTLWDGLGEPHFQTMQEAKGSTKT
jgi:hypothetical protein